MTTAPSKASEAEIAYTITPATAAERERLAKLPVFSMSAKSLGRKVARGDVLLAKKGEQIIGLLIAELYGFFDENVVSLVIVEEPKRRRGVGTALIHEAEKLFGKGKLFMATNESNAAMRSLCDKMGYIQVGRIDVPGEEDPELIFLKRLTTKPTK